MWVSHLYTIIRRRDRNREAQYNYDVEGRRKRRREGKNEDITPVHCRPATFRPVTPLSHYKFGNISTSMPKADAITDAFDSSDSDTAVVDSKKNFSLPEAVYFK